MRIDEGTDDEVVGLIAMPENTENTVMTLSQNGFGKLGFKSEFGELFCVGCNCNCLFFGVGIDTTYRRKYREHGYDAVAERLRKALHT